MMGRGKITIRRIDNFANRQVTFSKRSNGLLKKAKELAILCDAEIGIIIFTSAGRFLEFSSSSMPKIIERYRNVKEANRQQLNPTTDVKFWQGEVAQLKQQIQYLQQSHRRLCGEELSGLNFEDLQKLETQLESSLKNVRINKEQIFRDEIKELQRKGNIYLQENKELNKKIKLLLQDKEELQTKIYGFWNNDEATRNSKASNSIVIHDEAFALQLSQPQPQKGSIPTEAMKLML